MKKAHLYRFPLTVILGFILFFVIGPLLALKLASSPFIWIFGSGFLGCFFFAVITLKRNSIIAKCLVSLGIVVLALALFETFFSIMAMRYARTQRVENLTEDTLLVPHDYLGYTFKPDSVHDVRKFINENIIYEATYTIDSHGCRLAPPDKGADTEHSILFFGCSFTFGSGVSDTDTLPYRTGQKLDEEYRIFNFAREGYGPHQMLSALENSMVEEIVDVPPRFAIYQGMFPHIERAAGKVSWDTNGPRYSMGFDGRPIFRGPFSQSRFRAILWKQLLKSNLLYALSPFLYSNMLSDDLDVFISIIKESRRYLEGQYPDIEYHVIFWDEVENPVSHRILDELRSSGIEVHPVSEILPDVESIRFGDWGLEIVRTGFEVYDDHYVLHKHDRHPNPIVYNALAQFVVENIVKP